MLKGLDVRTGCHYTSSSYHPFLCEYASEVIGSFKRLLLLNLCDHFLRFMSLNITTVAS